MSEQSRFGIKGEKERHVFAFDRALLFARKVELGQGAKFKYEHKFNIPVSFITCREETDYLGGVSMNRLDK